MSRLEIRARAYSSWSGKNSMECYVNVDVGGLFRINSVRVAVSTKNTNLLNVFLPAYYNKKTGDSKQYLEFDYLQQNLMLKGIKEASRSAYRKYEQNRQFQEYGESFAVDTNNLYSDEVVDNLGNDTLTKEQDLATVDDVFGGQ